MTSRTPLGAQPRPPQRAVSSSGLSVQRPSHQRTLSAQYLPQSPVRKEALIDLTSDPNDAVIAQGRYGTMPRRGGSRLKLELSNESMVFEPLVTESPQTLTPSRIMPKNDTPSLVDMSSPASTKLHPTDTHNPPMPMPKRRPRFTLPATPKESPAPVVTTKKDGRPKAFTIEIPPAAPRYASVHKKTDAARSAYVAAASAKEAHETSFADFFPWMGNHAEDQLSENVVRHGFFDKVPVTQAEVTSAKSSIFPALKHKNGLNLLSSIFIGVLNQRKHNGQVTAPSAFKPPPRVTLTDTKREVWMRDLANPSISLRRLSRTIPHGIRGKGLLDHCLNKNVPTERAVWLVRCVGANDLRTVKRKGINGNVVMGGEVKWLKDWTVFVEQFVDSVASAFDDPDWKAKVHYAIRLATHLYAEHLVDRDHYMEWLVTSLENSPQAKLPMWILITQIYWKDMLRLRRYGRRLVAALLNHLTTIHNDPDRDILAQLTTKLASLLVNLISTSPDNFLSPQTWFKCRDALSSIISMDNVTVIDSFKCLNARNEKLVASTNTSKPATRQILIKHLDATFQSMYSSELGPTCWNVTSDKSMVVRTVLDWSTSFYRPGQAKVYVAITLFRNWALMGYDVTTAILASLDAAPPREMPSKRSLYQLVSELVRSGHFDLQAFTLWLLARGGLRDSSDTEPDAPCTARLLIDLPLHCLDGPFTQTRANLLRRASYDVVDEARDIETALKLVQRAIGLPILPDDPIAQRKTMALGKLCRAISQSGRALQTAVGARLVQIFHHDGFLLSATIFSTVRSILEAAEDYSMMANMIKSSMRFNDGDLLASCADTVNVHLPIFTAMGVAKDLCDMLLEKLKPIGGGHVTATRTLLASLCSLTSRMPSLSNTTAHLRKELQLFDRSTAIDACSPVSDNMAARLHDAESELHEEVEKLLSSGTSVDRPTMDRLFHTVVSRLEGCWQKATDGQQTYGALLAHLRVFDPQHFDVRMTDWVHHISALKARPALQDIYPYLISLGCLGLSTIMTTTSTDASKLVNAPVSSDSVATYMQEVLQLVTMPLPARVALNPEETYRFYIQQRIAPLQFQRELTILIRNALIEYAKPLQQIGLSVQAPLASAGMQNHVLDLLRLLVLHDPPATAQILGVKLADSPMGDLLGSITTRLLAPNKDPDIPMTFESVLEMANDLALPFCQLKLSIGLTTNKTVASSAEDQSPSHVGMLSRAMDQAVDTKNLTWTSVLPYLNEEITEHLKKQAQSRFLALFPSTKNSLAAQTSESEAIRMSIGLLSVVEALMQGRSVLRTPQLSPVMIDKLVELWEILAAGGEDKELRTSVLTHWLPILMKLITLHAVTNESHSVHTAPATTMRPPVAGIMQETRVRLLVAMSGVLLELDNISFEEAQASGDLRETVFDLALVLVDSLPEEARLQCTRALLSGSGNGSTQTCPTTSDARIRYIFSYSPPWMEHFMLAHRQTPSVPTTGPPRPRVPISVQGSDRLTPYHFRKWEMLCESSPVVGENDTALSLTLFEAIKVQ